VTLQELIESNTGVDKQKREHYSHARHKAHREQKALSKDEQGGWPTFPALSRTNNTVGAPLFAPFAKGGIPHRSPHCFLIPQRPRLRIHREHKCQGTASAVP
jgi:hypothetical protein